ncbi:MAG: TldD/PmbA family protein [Pseudomonadota bacterium]
MTADTDTATALLEAAVKAGAEAADVVVLAESSVGIGVSGGALEEAERSEGREAGLRVLIGGRQACVSSSDTGADALTEMAERAVALAREAPDDPYAGLADPALIGGYPDAVALDMEDPADPPTPEALEAMARAAEDAALAIEGVAQVEQASASTGRTAITVAATNGFHGSYARSSVGVGVSAIAGAGLGRERDFAGESRRHQSDMPTPEWIGDRAGRRAVAALNPRKTPAGAYPVLYDERVSLGLVMHLLSAVNGASVARGSSWLKDRMGEQVLPDGIDVWEDPLIARGSASRPFDAEGIPSAKRAIVENGMLKRWVLDCASARKLGLQTTGNARRSPSAPPSPGTTNVRITQGERSREDLLRDMGTGLLVTSFIGSSISPTTGSYSRGASGFWVEGGEIAYPVNEITVAGTLPEMLKTLVPANDADPHRGISAPSMLVEGLVIGA